MSKAAAICIKENYKLKKERDDEKSLQKLVPKVAVKGRYGYKAPI